MQRNPAQRTLGLALVFGMATAACRFEPGAYRDRDATATAGDDVRRDADPDEDGPLSQDAAPDAPPDALAAKPCPATYLLTDPARPNSRYRHVTASATWATAEMTCEADGGGAFLPTHLVVLDNEAERTWVYQQATTDKWVGVTDIKTEGALLAVTEQPEPYFGAAQSNNMSKDCMFVNQTVTVMETCGSMFPYLCECDGYEAEPNRFQ